MSAFDAWPGAPMQGSESWAMNGDPSSGSHPPWMTPPGLYAGGWGEPQGQWDTWGNHGVSSISKPRQMSMLGMKRSVPTSGVSISNKYSPLSEEVDMENKVSDLKSTTVFDNIFWKVGKAQNERKNTITLPQSKLQKYLYHNRSFCLDTIPRVSPFHRPVRVFLFPLHLMICHVRVGLQPAR